MKSLKEETNSASFAQVVHHNAIRFCMCLTFTILVKMRSKVQWNKPHSQTTPSWSGNEATVELPYSRLHELLTLQLISSRTCMVLNAYKPLSDLDPPVLPDPEQYKIHPITQMLVAFITLVCYCQWIQWWGIAFALLLIVQLYLASYSNREALNVAASYSQKPE